MALPWILMDTSAQGFIARVRRAATLPPNTRFTPEVLRAMADEEMRSRIVPALLKAGGEHLGFAWRVPVTAGRALVRLPPRTLRVRSLALEVGGRPVALERVDETSLQGASATGTPRVWAQESSGTVRLWPTPDTDCTLVARVYQYANVHVDPAGVGTIAAVATATSQLTLASAPPPGFVNGAKVDLLCGQPDFGWLACELTVDDVVGDVISLQESLPDTLAPGDFLVLAGETPVPQAPVPFHSVLVHAVAAECLRAQGDGEALAMQETALAKAEVSAAEAIAPSSHQPVTICQRDF